MDFERGASAGRCYEAGCICLALQFSVGSIDVGICAAQYQSVLLVVSAPATYTSSLQRVFQETFSRRNNFFANWICHSL